MDDLTNAIAYEVKQEIADRYFGMRTQIETRSRAYLEQIQKTDHTLGEAIALDLLRLRHILALPELFHTFLKLIDLPAEDAIALCARPAPIPAKIELFQHLRCRGLTRKQRFRSLATTVYCSLAKNIAAYHAACRLLQQEHEEICSEIEKFERQNDLADILSFLRTLDCGEADRRRHLHAEGNSATGASLEAEMRLKPPLAASTQLLQIRPLPPLPQIKTPLHKLLDTALASNLDGS